MDVAEIIKIIDNVILSHHSTVNRRIAIPINVYAELVDLRRKLAEGEEQNNASIIWKELDIDNLSDDLVLAANFKPRTYGYSEKVLGSLYVEKGLIICENEYEVLEGCTHYVEVGLDDIEIKKKTEELT